MSGILPLGSFIPALSPRWSEPTHLAPLVSLLERALVEPVRGVVSIPPRMGKTETELHAISWWLLQRPDLRIALAGYAQRFIDRRSRRARNLARKAGVELAPDAAARADWRTAADDGEGGCWATSIEGAITGEGFDIVLVDDPVKDRAAAESAGEREKTYDWFNDVLYTRLEPRGSCIVVQTRWHTDDLAGRLERDGWPVVNIPAIDGEGRSLWPERWSVERLHEVRDQIGDYGWTSLYMGRPKPRGGALFADVHLFDVAPENLRIAIGCDLAYSTRTHADYSVAVVVGSDGDRCYVLDVVRQQVQAPIFKATLERLREQYQGAPIVSYVGGTERGVVDMMAAQGLVITAKPAVADKFTRAQGASAKWNVGKVLVRRGAPWLDAFVTEVCGFTGIGDRHDDQVDALAAAIDSIAAPRRAHGSNFVVRSFESTPIGYYDGQDA